MDDIDDCERMEQIDNLCGEIDELKALLRDIKGWFEFHGHGDSLLERIDNALKGT